MSHHYRILASRSISHPIAIAQTVLSNPPNNSILIDYLSPIEDSGVQLIRDLRAIVDRYHQQIRVSTQIKK